MFTWKDKQNGVDDVLAEDINDIAHSVIELEKEVGQNVIDQAYTPTSENAQSGKAVAEAMKTLSNKQLLISLPSKYDLVVGDTFELFWKGIVLASDVYHYNIKVTCSIGSCFKRKYMVTPTTSGSYPLKVEVYDDGEKLLAEASTTLVVSNPASNPSTPKNVLCVGDSLLVSGRWAREACRRLSSTGGSPEGLGLTNVFFIGNKRTGNNTGYEAEGGWTFESYNTANKSASIVWITTASDNLADLSKLGERGTWYYKGKEYKSGNTSVDNARAIMLDVVAGETYYFRQYLASTLKQTTSTNNAMYVTCWDANGEYVAIPMDINVTEVTIPDGGAKIAATFICHQTSNTDEQLNCYPYITKNPNIPETYVAYGGGHKKTEDDQHSVYEDTNGTRWKIETIETERLKMIRTSGSTNMPSSGVLTHISGGVDTSDIVYTSAELGADNPFWNDTPSDNLADLRKLGERGTWYYKGKEYKSGNEITDNSRAIILDVVAGETYYFRSYLSSTLKQASNTNYAIYTTFWDAENNYVETSKEQNLTEVTVPDGAVKMATTFLTHDTNQPDDQLSRYPYISKNPTIPETYVKYSNCVDFKIYAQKLGVSSIDYCCVLLGWNTSNWDEKRIKDGAIEFIDNLLYDFPNCKIALLGIQVPSLDGFGVNYGCSWNWFEKTKYVFNLNDWYTEIADEYDNVTFVNISGQFDTEYGMPIGTRPVNIRSSVTETYQTNGVHPDGTGDYQISDAVFRHINYELYNL